MGRGVAAHMLIGVRVAVGTGAVLEVHVGAQTIGTKTEEGEVTEHYIGLKLRAQVEVEVEVEVGVGGVKVDEEAGVGLREARILPEGKRWRETQGNKSSSEETARKGTRNRGTEHNHNSSNARISGVPDNKKSSQIPGLLSQAGFTPLTTPVEVRPHTGTLPTGETSNLNRGCSISNAEVEFVQPATLAVGSAGSLGCTKAGISSISPDTELQQEHSPVTSHINAELSNIQALNMPRFHLISDTPVPTSSDICLDSAEKVFNSTDIPCSPISPDVSDLDPCPLTETPHHSPSLRNLTAETVSLQKLDALLQDSPDHIARVLTKDEILQALDLVDTEITSIESQLKELENDKKVKSCCTHAGIATIPKDQTQKIGKAQAVPTNSGLQKSMSHYQQNELQLPNRIDNSTYLERIVDSLIATNRQQAKCHKEHSFVTSPSSSASFDVSGGPSFIAIKNFLKAVHSRQDEHKLDLTATYKTLQEKWLVQVNTRLESLRQSPGLRSYGCSNTATSSSSVPSSTTTPQVHTSPALPFTTVTSSSATRDPQQVEQDAISRFQRCPTFVDNNRLMENPLDEEKERKSQDNWTNDDKSNFVVQFLQHPKAFPEIAKALNRSTGEIVAFYYLHRHELNLPSIVRKANAKKRSRNKETQDSYTSQSNMRDNSAAIYSTMAEVIAEWTPHEQKQFLDGLQQYGKDWSSISCLLSCTKSSRQCKAYYTANRRKLGLDTYLPRDAKKVAPRRDRTATAEWTSDEVTQFLEKFAVLGTEWRAMAQYFTTRTASQLKSFYLENKDKFGLQEPEILPQSRKRTPRNHASTTATTTPEVEQSEQQQQNTQKPIRRCPKRRKKQIETQNINSNSSPLPPAVVSPEEEDLPTRKQPSFFQKPFSVDVAIVQDVLDEISFELDADQIVEPCTTSTDGLPKNPPPQPPSPSLPSTPSIAVPASPTIPSTSQSNNPQSPPTPPSSPSTPSTPTTPPLQLPLQGNKSPPRVASPEPLPNKIENGISESMEQPCIQKPVSETLSHSQESQPHPPASKKVRYNNQQDVGTHECTQLDAVDDTDTATCKLEPHTSDSRADSNECCDSPSPPVLSPALSPIQSPHLMASPPSPTNISGQTTTTPSNTESTQNSNQAPPLQLPGIASVYEAGEEHQLQWKCFQ
ncbi:nuclear receptor corepressor 1 [Pelomyxa schiedti]|nr:nuclear receptor corepressor 1 [Pelomyxa schiedti]